MTCSLLYVLSWSKCISKCPEWFTSVWSGFKTFRNEGESVRNGEESVRNEGESVRNEDGRVRIWIHCPDTMRVVTAHSYLLACRCVRLWMTSYNHPPTHPVNTVTLKRTHPYTQTHYKHCHTQRETPTHTYTPTHSDTPTNSHTPTDTNRQPPTRHIYLHRLRPKQLHTHSYRHRDKHPRHGHTPKCTFLDDGDIKLADISNRRGSSIWFSNHLIIRQFLTRDIIFLVEFSKFCRKWMVLPILLPKPQTNNIMNTWCTIRTTLLSYQQCGFDKKRKWTAHTGFLNTVIHQGIREGAV